MEGVRSVTNTDEARVGEVLARAFFDDPVTRWIVREDRWRDRALQTIFRRMFRLYAPFGLSCITEDGVGVALWAPHDRYAIPWWKEVLSLPMYVRVSGWSRLVRASSGVDTMKKHHPHTPHRYLFAIGVDPREQRKGHGSRLLSHSLAACDELRMAAYLEATGPQNKALYLRHGFSVTAEFPFGTGGPQLTAMWRDPR